ncbi:MAG: MFS transporter, partial [Chlamydiota bacterium]
HFNIKNLATIALFGMALLAATVALLGSPLWLYLPFLLYGVGNGLFNACIYPMVSNAAEREDQGKAFGVLVSMNSFAQVLAPAVSGLLLAYHPDIPLLFGSLIFFITGVMSLCTFSFILRGHKS